MHKHHSFPTFRIRRIRTLALAAMEEILHNEGDLDQIEYLANTADRCTDVLAMRDLS